MTFLLSHVSPLRLPSSPLNTIGSSTTSPGPSCLLNDVPCGLPKLTTMSVASTHVHASMANSLNSDRRRLIRGYKRDGRREEGEMLLTPPPLHDQMVDTLTRQQMEEIAVT